MKRTVGLVFGLALVAFASVASADKLSDFKEAVEKTGCKAIPYGSERSDCESAQTKKNETCKEFSCNRADVEKRLEKLKEKRKSLEEAKSRNNESAISDLERVVRALEDELKDDKSNAERRIRRCEDCVSAREGVQRVFAKVRSMVKGESDEALKPYVDRLVSHYDKGTEEHVRPSTRSRRRSKTASGLPRSASDAGDAMRDLLAEIAAAFPARPLPPTSYDDGRGMWDAYIHRQTFEEGSAGKSWDDLGDQFVEVHYGALRWMKPDVFAAVLPAYLAALVRGSSQNELPDAVANQLTRREGWESDFDARIAALTDAQRHVVTAVLEQLPQTDRWSHYRAEFGTALASWKAFAAPPAP